MKIVIIGSDGQLGQDCQNILAQDHQLLTPTLEELNLCNKSEVLTYLTTQRADVVINCAAYTAVDKCEKEKELCRKINAEGPAHVAKACSETSSRLIHISTDYVFDGTKPVPQSYNENDAVNPLSQYGVTKLDGERVVQNYCQNHVILRTAWLYSAHGPNFLKTMLRLSLTDPLVQRKVVHDQYGSLTWSYTLAQQISKLLDSSLRGIVHTTSNGYSTWYEAACYFLERMGIKHTITPCSTKDYPTLAHRPANSILANSILDSCGLSVFSDWKNDLDLFVERHGAELTREIQK
jgi:dTDP-4-dehydrorhamnose reductase